MPLWCVIINWYISVIFHPILTVSFFKCSSFKTNRMVTITKLYFLYSRFWFFPVFALFFALRQYCSICSWAVLHTWIQNHPQNVGTCPGLPSNSKIQTQYRFFQSDRPEPPPPPPPPPLKMTNSSNYIDLPSESMRLRHLF